MLKKTYSLSIAQVIDSLLIQAYDKWSLQDGQDIFDYYINNGYEVYDVYAHHGGTPANAFSAVASATLTNVLCVWTGTPNSSYNLNSSYFTGKNVVILDCTIESLSSYVLTAYHSKTVSFTSLVAWTYSNLKFESFYNVSFSNLYNYAISGITLFNCYISSVSGTGGSFQLNNWNMSYCKIVIPNTTTTSFSWDSGRINNVYFDFANASSDASLISFSGTLYLKDVVVVSRYTGSSYGVCIGGGGGSNLISCDNVLLLGATGKNTFSIRALYNSSNVYYMHDSFVVINTYSNNTSYIKDEPVIPPYYYNERIYKLNDTYLPPANTNFNTIYGIVNVEQQYTQTVGGKLSRQYYTLTFNGEYWVDDDLKNFNPNYDWIIRRTDIESVFLPVEMCIVDLGFHYKNTSGPALTYNNDENFLIIATGSDSGEKHIFIYYSGSLYKTVFSNPQYGKQYEITGVFQIWQIDSINSVRNIHNITDSQLEGSIRFNNLDNEVVVK